MSSLRDRSSPWWQAGERLWTEKLREQVVETLYSWFIHGRTAQGVKKQAAKTGLA